MLPEELPWVGFGWEEEGVSDLKMWFLTGSCLCFLFSVSSSLLSLSLPPSRTIPQSNPSFFFLMN